MLRGCAAGTGLPVRMGLATVKAQPGWVRFTNDATGHSMAVGGQNYYSF
jgi:hypothetical protein